MPQRKIRKGTHSCWQCRRRKVRCHFPAVDAPVCTPCSIRGTVCQRQDSSSPTDMPQQRERTHAQRLDRLEELMQRLVDRISPDNVTTITRTIETPGNEEVLLGSPQLGLTPDSNFGIYSLSTGVSHNQQFKGISISKKLWTLFPSQKDIDTIWEASPGTMWITEILDSHARIKEKTKMPMIPAITSHPCVLSRALLQLAICMQQLSPAFDRGCLELESIAKEMTEIVSWVSTLVISDDDMISNISGLQCIILHGIWHANAGNTRKAWLIFRRALNLAQLVGVRPTNFSPKTTKPHNSTDKIWFILVAFDRYLSLFLGLRVDIRDNSFLDLEQFENSPEEKLEMLHAVIAAEIVERNLTQNNNKTYALTQTIDYELDTGAKRMSQVWWTHQPLPLTTTPVGNWEYKKRLMIQIHHFTLLIMLHLPYLLSDPTEDRYIYNKLACIRASREILPRFLSFRTQVESVYSCRHIDYAGSIAAMTLLLSYLVQGGQVGPTAQIHIPISDEEQRAQDCSLITTVKDRMEQVALLNDDKLSRESAQVINSLFPLIANVKGSVTAAVAVAGAGTSANPIAKGWDGSGCETETIQLKVPYLGLVTILLSSQKNILPARSPEANLDPAAENGLDLEQMLLGDSGYPVTTSNMGENIFIHIEPQDLESVSETMPSLTAEASVWPFQGIDTNFWSLVYGGIGSDAGVEGTD